MNDPDCLLCQIASGALRARRVVENARAIAVMNDVEAMSRGHVVAFPRRHAARLDGCDDEDLAAALILLKRVAATLHLESYNLLPNNGDAAGQTVFHVHFHLIPRWSETEGLRYERPLRRRLDHGDLYLRLRDGLPTEEG